MELLELRKRINDIDEKIVKLIAERRKISKEIVEAKEVTDKPIRDPKREEELLVRLIEIGKEHGISQQLVSKVFYEIIDDSIRLQHSYLQRLANQNEMHTKQLRVAIQGIEGSYSYLAAKKFFSSYNDDLILISGNRFDDVVNYTEKGEADYAILPIENTTSGGINEVYDLLLHTTLSIVGEERHEVNHCLVAKDEISTFEIKKIYAHYQAAAQCSRFLSSLPDCAIEYFADTAMSVKKIKEEKNKFVAAIASKEAANLFNVKILRENIANQSENFTRFIVCARKPVSVDSRIECKTSLVIATAQTAGSLVDALNVFRKYGLNLTKLESRPVMGNPWEEMFYLDFLGNIADEKVKKAVEELNKHTRFVKVLGSYPSQEITKTKVADQEKDV
ncbi:MAG: prephenate dehydratase [Melioribacteraceae bacterium]|nr:prephenate dehydratase [Melioribacteraceae bacterium]